MLKASVLWWVFGGSLLLLLTAEILILVANVRTRRQAEALLRDMRSIKVGESTTDDILRIVQHYPAAPKGSSSACAADESHSIRIANDAMNRFAFATPALRVFGARPAGIVATFLLQKGHACYLSYSFAVIPGASAQDLVAEASEWLFTCDDRANGNPRDACYEVDEGVVRQTKELKARLSYMANAKEREHGFGFDFSCLTSLRGCQRLCQMNPSVWRDYVAKAQKEGWALPPEEINDPRCLAIER